jgi:hypothetical protein
MKRSGRNFTKTHVPYPWPFMTETFR